MFVRYFVELPLDHRRVTEFLTHDPQGRFQQIAEDATRRGDAMLAHAGSGDEDGKGRSVTLEFGPPVHMSLKTVLPMLWIPSGADGSFPPLDADLEIAGLAPERTQLAISARFAPPQGPTGRGVDRVVLSRVAETTAKEFLDEVGHAVMASSITA